MEATIKVLKIWGKQHQTSMKSETLKAMLQRLVKLGILAKPIDCMKPELWPQIEAELTEQAKLGKPEHLVAWGKVNAMMKAIQAEQEACTDAHRGLQGLSEGTTQIEEPADSSSEEEGIKLREAWPTEGKPPDKGREGGRNITPPSPPTPPPVYPWGALPKAETEVQPVDLEEKWRKQRQQWKEAMEAAQKEQESKKRQPQLDPLLDWLPGAPAPSEEAAPWNVAGPAKPCHTEELGNPLAHWREEKTQAESDDENEGEGLKYNQIGKEGTVPKREETKGEEKITKLLARLTTAVQELAATAQQNRGMIMGGAPSPLLPEPPTDWRLIAKECVMSGVKLEPAAIRAYPDRVTPRGQQEWHPLDAKAVQALFKTVSEHGLGHPETTLLLETILALPLIPADVRQLAKAILKPAMFLLWKEAWGDRINALVQEAADQHHPLHGTTFDRLTGRGAFSTIPAQLQLWPGEFIATTKAGKKAFMDIAKLEKKEPLGTSVKQGQNEPFLQFVNRLHDAVTESDLPDSAKEAVIIECIRQQSNLIIKSIVKDIPLNTPVATLLRQVVQKEAMIHAPGNIHFTERPVPCRKNNFRGIHKRSRQANRQGPRPSRSGPCWVCGKPGHWARDCWYKHSQQGNKRGGARSGGRPPPMPNRQPPQIRDNFSYTPQVTVKYACSCPREGLPSQEPWLWS
ncbi:uncharacterized protein LOC113488570 [Athene cunicularia]|uniref:uncharacterized protein LOC113488570 n=1 Tax=Athene cunicularia TaxID=194338 RepID=UPI000EF6A0C4|nr:uncharacterized protein LOC113488570 [Athene cunicularia]